MAEPDMSAGAVTIAEIASQPEMWERVLSDAHVGDALPRSGERVLALGCGTSFYIAEAWAHMRNEAGLGRTRAAVPSQLTWVEEDESILLLSRSGTTGDVERVGRELAGAHRVVGIIGTAGTPIEALCEERVLLDFADERSVVQTRFATTTLALLRRSIAQATGHLPEQAREALGMDLPLGGHDHVVFLGSGWSAAIAHEAALKLLEASGAWTEAYPLREYQHGPIAAADERTLVWSMSPVDEELRENVERTGASLREATLDPMAELVLAHRVAIELARRAGRDPDQPAHLSRSVVSG